MGDAFKKQTYRGQNSLIRLFFVTVISRKFTEKRFIHLEVYSIMFLLYGLIKAM